MAACSGSFTEPPAFSTFSIADRLSPVRGSAARRATAALACFFAVPAAVLPAAIMPLVRPEAPEMEALGLAVAMATVTVAVAHFAAAFGMASGAHTPQLVLAASTTGQGGAGAGGTEITAFPITTGFLALVLGITAAIWPPYSLALPLVAILLFGGYNHRGEVVWERAEVQS